MHKTVPMGLTQYDPSDKINLFDQYNKDMLIINNTTSYAAGRIEQVEQNSVQRDIKLNARIDVTTASVSAMALRMEQDEQDIQANMDNIQNNYRDIVNLQTTTASISSAIMEHIATSTSVVAGIQKKIDENYASLVSKQFADEQRIAVNETAIANHQEEIDKLKSGETNAGNAIVNLQNAVAALQEVDSSTAESVSDLRDRMIEQESASQTNANNVTELDNRLTAAEQNIEDLQNITILPPITKRFYAAVNNNRRTFNIASSAHFKVGTKEYAFWKYYFDDEYTDEVTGISVGADEAIGKVIMLSASAYSDATGPIPIYYGDDLYVYNNIIKMKDVVNMAMYAITEIE